MHYLNPPKETTKLFLLNKLSRFFVSSTVLFSVDAAFGILSTEPCEMVWLDPDEEPHFISGIDGSLFIPKTEKFHLNHEYCLEYYFDKDAEDASTDDTMVTKKILLTLSCNFVWNFSVVDFCLP